MDPNFPAGLDIHPSSCPTHLENPNYAPEAQKESIKKFGIAGRVWEAAYAMISYIEPSGSIQFDPPFLSNEGPLTRPRTIIELGSGSGLVANHLAKTLRLDDILVATDLPEVCELLEENLAGTQTLVKPLAWGNVGYGLALAQYLASSKETEAPRALSAIICSDLVLSSWDEGLIVLLTPSSSSSRSTSPNYSLLSFVPLIQLSSPTFLSPIHTHDPPPVYISYKVRSLSKEMPFWAAFGLWFDFSPVLVRDAIPNGDETTNSSDNAEWRRFGSEFEDSTFLFVASRRPESYHWVVPSDDSALLAGRGAQGSDSPKADGTFEALLLMSITGS